jgi:hypothetical protein
MNVFTLLLVGAAVYFATRPEALAQLGALFGGSGLAIDPNRAAAVALAWLSDRAPGFTIHGVNGIIQPDLAAFARCPSDAEIAPAAGVIAAPPAPAGWSTGAIVWLVKNVPPGPGPRPTVPPPMMWVMVDPTGRVTCWNGQAV